VGLSDDIILDTSQRALPKARSWGLYWLRLRLFAKAVN